MSNPVWKIMRALAGVENGSDCRSCGESIQRRDAVGRRGGVRPPCRPASPPRESPECRQVAATADEHVPEIAPAQESDLEGITAIYNDVTAPSTAVFSDLPVTVENRREWLAERRARGF